MPFFAFTACETSISPLGCIIEGNKPLFIGVSEMLSRSTENTVSILEQELLVKKSELEEQWHFASLETHFYRKAYLPRYRRARNVGRCDSSHPQGLWLHILVI